jgi:hypothetical protein
MTLIFNQGTFMKEPSQMPVRGMEYLQSMVPISRAFCRASGIQPLRLALRVELDGWVLKNSGPELPRLSMRCQKSTDSSGL